MKFKFFSTAKGSFQEGPGQIWKNFSKKSQLNRNPWKKSFEMFWAKWNNFPVQICVTSSDGEEKSGHLVLKGGHGDEMGDGCVGRGLHKLEKSSLNFSKNISTGQEYRP